MRTQLLIVALLTTHFSCQPDIELAELIDENSPIILTVRVKNGQFDDFRTDTIFVNSAKWNKLKQFASTNSSGWMSTPASYISDFHLSQNDFHLMGWDNGTSVVINFIDTNGEVSQLTKCIEPGELNFLTE